MEMSIEARLDMLSAKVEKLENFLAPHIAESEKMIEAANVPLNEVGPLSE